MSVIDRSVLDELAEVMGEEFPELVHTYLESTPGLIEELEAAAATDGVDDLVRPAHSLKSSSNDLGVQDLAAEARAIEHAARAGDDSARQRVSNLRAHFERARSDLTAILDGR